MKELISNNSVQTMSSLQIAEISGKNHWDVMKAIRKMEVAWEKVNQSKFSLVEYIDAKGEKRPCYKLTKTECLYIATKFNDEARARLVIRWEELEKADTPKVPTTFREALLLAAEQQKLIEEQQAQIEAQNSTIIEQTKAIAFMEPRLSYLDDIISNPSTVLVTQIAQDYGYSAKRFNKILNDMGIQHKVGRQWILYGKYIAQGYVHSDTQTIETPKGNKIVMLTKWTQKGRLFLYEQLKTKGILPLIDRNN